jgi:hypothetical protein
MQKLLGAFQVDTNGALAGEVTPFFRSLSLTLFRSYISPGQTLSLVLFALFEAWDAGRPLGPLPDAAAPRIELPLPERDQPGCVLL